MHNEVFGDSLFFWLCVLTTSYVDVGGGEGGDVPLFWCSVARFVLSRNTVTGWVGRVWPLWLSRIASRPAEGLGVLSTARDSMSHFSNGTTLMP
ncbi:hypothetical protein R3P38DRAFT_725727 [Favolaschia claudopus]|uniref:Secreted protein n=1 Tax=Favolaschia claudopus TaxID=2862362 RepID=A0AAW0C5N1_9AGAR